MTKGTCNLLSCPINLHVPILLINCIYLENMSC